MQVRAKAGEEGSSGPRGAWDSVSPSSVCGKPTRWWRNGGGWGQVAQVPAWEGMASPGETVASGGVLRTPVSTVLCSE